jgi:hypothetical protein
MRFSRGLRLATFTSVVFAGLLATAQPALAQNNNDNEDGGVGVGALAMMAVPKLRGDVQATFDSKTGYGFGLWVGGNKNGLVGFTGEFIYLIKKFELDGETSKQYALEIPAVFHINFGSSSRNSVGGYGVIGPVFTLNVKDKLTGGLAGNNFAGADVGIMAGAGVEVTRVGFEVRGNWGLRNISDEGVTSETKTFTLEVVGKVRFN